MKNIIFTLTFTLLASPAFAEPVEVPDVVCQALAKALPAAVVGNRVMLGNMSCIQTTKLDAAGKAVSKSAACAGADVTFHYVDADSDKSLELIEVLDDNGYPLQIDTQKSNSNEKVQYIDLQGFKCTLPPPDDLKDSAPH